MHRFLKPSIRMDLAKINKAIRRVEGKLLNIQDIVDEDPELKKALHLERVILEDQLENLKTIKNHLESKGDL